MTDHGRRRYGIARTSLAAGAVALASAVPAATQAPVFSPAMKAARVAVNDGRYLEASEMLADEALGRNGQEVNPLALQLYRQITPFMTNELPPAELGDLDAANADARRAAARLAAAEPRDALAEIVARARASRVVILNESHFSPRDRAFALEVARALRPLGYSILAAETFVTEAESASAPLPVDRLRRDGFVRRGTGFYTLDPVFAAFVREALRIGYRPAAYEWTSKQWKDDGDIATREQAQAENLAAALRDAPDAKLLVFMGHGHVVERSNASGGTPMMAERFAKLTGVDPLTIDQTSLSDLVAASRARHVAATRRMGDRPAVLLERGRPLVVGSISGGVDLQVAHPTRRYREGRPAWLWTLGGRSMPIPARLRPVACPRLIQAFATDAPADAVPLDQVLVEPGAQLPSMVVPVGDVRWAVQDVPCNAQAGRRSR